MNIYKALSVLLFISFLGCKNDSTKSAESSKVVCIGAMKDVMWKGELQGKVLLDSLNKNGLYGIGPAEYLRGELLVIDGTSYKSTVTSDSTMQVLERFEEKAPFFVFGNVLEWKNSKLPNDISSISDLEDFMNSKFENSSEPFVFKLKGKVENATIHIQNLPVGTKVSSPKEAHQGQTNYTLNNESVEIVGFYSTKHKGIFTHHDSNMHLHLITSDKQKMGHLDELSFKKDDFTISFPK